MTAHITRRIILGTSASVLTLGFARGTAAGAPPELELFIFTAPDSGNLAFAVIGLAGTATSGLQQHAGIYTTFHAGSRSWTVQGICPLQTGVISERLDHRVFAGKVFGPRGVASGAVVLEPIPDFVKASGRLAFWAEVRDATGSRFRVGNPFVSELLADDPKLTDIYHAASPDEDRALFTNAFERRVSAMAAASGVTYPHAYARRVVAAVLPDVIECDPNSTIGFNFASRNGRHPADATASVVTTMLTGALASGRSSTTFRLGSSFPYFQHPSAVA
ncbi:MAG: hypothetical protein WCA56_11575 [Xanthobacteraceae bacterium]